MASLSDILTAAQNVASAINQAAQTYREVQGALDVAAMSAATLVKSGQGRLASVSVTTAGSAVGAIYDNNNVSSTLRPIYVIPMTVGVVFVNLPVGYGIVVAPGSGQVVTVSYS